MPKTTSPTTNEKAPSIDPQTDPSNTSSDKNDPPKQDFENFDADEFLQSLNQIITKDNTDQENTTNSAESTDTEKNLDENTQDTHVQFDDKSNISESTYFDQLKKMIDEGDDASSTLSSNTSSNRSSIEEIGSINTSFQIITKSCSKLAGDLNLLRHNFPSKNELDQLKKYIAELEEELLKTSSSSQESTYYTFTAVSKNYLEGRTKKISESIRSFKEIVTAIELSSPYNEKLINIYDSKKDESKKEPFKEILKSTIQKLTSSFDSTQPHINIDEIINAFTQVTTNVRKSTASENLIPTLKLLQRKYK
jgi:hypothetical protein